MSVYLLSMFSGIVNNIPTKFIISLLGLIVLDYITGVLSVIYLQKVNSKVHYKGIIKKLSLLLSVITGIFIDIFLETNGLVAISIIILLSINESLSIIENLGKLGVPLPDFIQKVLVQLKEKVNNGDYKKEDDNNEKEK